MSCLNNKTVGGCPTVLIEDRSGLRKGAIARFDCTPFGASVLRDKKKVGQYGFDFYLLLDENTGSPYLTSLLCLNPGENYNTRGDHHSQHRRSAEASFAYPLRIHLAEPLGGVNYDRDSLLDRFITW